MAIAESILPEFDHEMASTRRVLERIPEDRADWKPHPKSMSIGDLGLHLANLPHWGSMTINQDELDMNPPEGFPPRSFTSTEALLQEFDSRVVEARAALEGTSDTAMMQPWTLKSGEHTIFSMPRAVVFRSFVMNHSIHHRGQLTVYLRLLDVPLPSVYGPTADEAA